LPLLLCAAFGAYLTLYFASAPAFSWGIEGERTFIIDAGHGGEDGGAVSQSGVVEKDINLAIAQDLSDLLTFLGEQTVMTRTEDISIHDETAKTLHEKKVSDLKNRVKLVNSTENGVLVSIHQNSMPSAKSVCGAQVFYREGSEETAKRVQAALNEVINENAKTEKRISSDVYLMKHVERPAILVECGFLSNANETKKLIDSDYQRLLAAVIAAGLLNDT